MEDDRAGAGSDPRGFIAASLTAAERRVRRPWEFTRDALGRRPREGSREVAEVSWLGLDVDDDGAFERFEVRPRGDLAGPEHARWRAVQRRWAEDRAWRSEGAEGGALRLRRAVRMKEIRRRVERAVGREAAAALPPTLASPAPGEPRPITPAALRLAVGKVAARERGSVPFDALRELASALPGWSVTEGVAPYAPENERGLRLAGELLRRAAPGAEPVVSRCLHARGSGGAPLDLGALRAALRCDDVTRGGSPWRAMKPFTLLASDVRPDPDGAAPGGDPGPLALVHNPLIVAPAWVVRAPGGAENRILRWEALFPPDPRRTFGRAVDAVGYDDEFWAWAYDRGFGEDAERAVAALDPEDVRHAVRYGAAADESNTGQCQLCPFRRWKLAWVGIPGTRVVGEHGYEFPGRQGVRGGLRGRRSESCEGAGHPPYEHSCDLARKALARAEAAVAAAEARAANPWEILSLRMWAAWLRRRVERWRPLPIPGDPLAPTSAGAPR